MNIKHLTATLSLALCSFAAAGCEEVAVDPWKTNLAPGLCEEVRWCLCEYPTDNDPVPLCYDQGCNVCYSTPSTAYGDWWSSEYSAEPMSCDAEMSWDRWRECRSTDYRPGM